MSWNRLPVRRRQAGSERPSATGSSEQRERQVENQVGDLRSYAQKLVTGDQAAVLVCGSPSLNSTPFMISGRRFFPPSLRHFFFADIISLQTMASAVLRLMHPPVRIPGHPPTYSDFIRPPVPGIRPPCDGLP